MLWVEMAAWELVLPLVSFDGFGPWLVMKMGSGRGAIYCSSQLPGGSRGQNKNAARQSNTAPSALHSCFVHIINLY